jgi:hypothetical protein
MAKIEFQKNSDHYKIVMFGKINFSGGDQQTVETVGVRLVLRGECATELLRNSECLFASGELKFERYCDTCVGFAMTNVDMGCGA